MHNMQISDIKAALRAGKYTSLGSYPTFFLTANGGCLCHDCVRENWRDVVTDTKHSEYCGGWNIVAHDINWEEADMLCDHCGTRIESAYNENDDDSEEDAA